MWPLRIFWLKLSSYSSFSGKFLSRPRSVSCYASSNGCSVKNAIGTLTHIAMIASRELPHHKNAIPQTMVALNFPTLIPASSMSEIIGLLFGFLPSQTAIRIVHTTRRLGWCWVGVTWFFSPFSNCCILYNVKKWCFLYFIFLAVYFEWVT